MLNIGVISLGCAKNQVDTERMLGMLTGAGYALVTDPRKAQILIVNTCGFIEPAKQESINAILEMAQYKKTGVCHTLVVTGCLSQRYPAELAEALPEVDLFLGVRDSNNYLACQGDTAVGDASVDDYRTLRGVFRSRRQNDGTFRPFTMSNIVDGTSNTIAFGEVVTFSKTNDIRGGMAVEPSTYTVADCLGRAVSGVLTGDESGPTESIADTWYNGDSHSLGAKYTEAIPACNAFNTILPPNSPSCCAPSALYGASGGNLTSASSYHAGGANVCLCDGSVRFVSSTVNALSPGKSYSSYTRGTIHNGESPYGIWGAMGSREGGESTTL